MSIEHLDIQWTVVCDGSAQAAFAAAKSRAESHGWTLELEVKSSAGDVISIGGGWPSETSGSGRYIKAESETKRTLFWSTYSEECRAKITGGLYLHEFARDSTDAFAACDLAIADLRHLFGGPEVSCLVLALEDDEGIDVSPGIVGVYRAVVWREVSGEGRGGVVEHPDGDWVIVRPAVEKSVLASVYSMPEPIQDSLKAIQTGLDRMFWRAPEKS